MKPLSNAYKRRWAFFMNPKTGKVQYNKKCQACTHDCRQSFRAEVVCCKHYSKNQMKTKVEQV
jgi:hypothetical protein